MSDKSNAAWHPHKAPLWLFIDINPEPWAVGPIQAYRAGKKIGARMGKNQQLAAFQEAVREAVRKQWGGLPMLTGKMQLDVYLWRARAAYKTDKDIMHRKHEADATNMLKGIEDALQGVLYPNDRDNISVSSHIIEQREDARGKIVVRLQVVDPVRHIMDLFSSMPLDIIRKINDHEESTGVEAASDLSWGPTDNEEMF